MIIIMMRETKRKALEIIENFNLKKHRTSQYNEKWLTRMNCSHILEFCLLLEYHKPCKYAVQHIIMEKRFFANL